MPLADDDDDNDGDDGCGVGSDTPLQADQFAAVSTTLAVHVPDSPPATILSPYENHPTPRPPPFPSLAPSPNLHATLPVSHRDQTPAILGTTIGIMIVLLALFLTRRYVIHRRRMTADPFKDPPKSRFIAFRLGKTAVPKKRLSDESWVSPALPSLLSSPVSPLSEDLELRRYACPQRKLVPVTTPVCTPTDTEFGSRLEFANCDPGLVIPVPLVQVPSPVYIPPFSPSPSLSSSTSLSPTPSTEPLNSPSSNPARLSRLLSSTFGDIRSPTRPTTAHLIQTARSYATAYRPPSAAATSLYIPPTPFRFSGTRSRTGFCPSPADEARGAWGTVRDTFSTVTTSDTDMVCTLPHLRRAASEFQLSISPFGNPVAVNEHGQIANGSVMEPSPSTEGNAQTTTPAGTALGLKLRLSDASEHARYRLRERERQRKRQHERGKSEGGEERLSADSQTSAVTVTSVTNVAGVRQRSGSLEVVMRKEFKLRDSESVLREIGW